MASLHESSALLRVLTAPFRWYWRQIVPLRGRARILRFIMVPADLIMAYLGLTWFLLEYSWRNRPATDGPNAGVVVDSGIDTVWEFALYDVRFGRPTAYMTVTFLVVAWALVFVRRPVVLFSIGVLSLPVPAFGIYGPMNRLIHAIETGSISVGRAVDFAMVAALIGAFLIAHTYIFSENAKTVRLR